MPGCVSGAPIDIVGSPENFIVKKLIEQLLHRGYKIHLRERAQDCSGGRYLFLVACPEVLPMSTLELYAFSAVLHASDLPQGRGWSPVNWAIVRGDSELTISAIEVARQVDTGGLLKKKRISLLGNETYPEIMTMVALAEADLVIELVEEGFPHPESQVGAATYCRKRTLADSLVDVGQSLEEVFDLLRASDPNRYPVHFRHRDRTYKLSLEAFGER